MSQVLFGRSGNAPIPPMLKLLLAGGTLEIAGILIAFVYTSPLAVAIDSGVDQFAAAVTSNLTLVFSEIFDYLFGATRAIICSAAILLALVIFYKLRMKDATKVARSAFKNRAIFAYSALLLGTAITWVIKLAAQRPRKDGGAITANTDPFSMPSGHTSFAATAMIILVFIIRKRLMLVIGILVIFAVGLSRLILGVHYFTDVFSAALIGTGVVLTMAALFLFRE